MLHRFGYSLVLRNKSWVIERRQARWDGPRTWGRSCLPSPLGATLRSWSRRRRYQSWPSPFRVGQVGFTLTLKTPKLFSSRWVCFLTWLCRCLPSQKTNNPNMHLIARPCKCRGRLGAGPAHAPRRFRLEPLAVSWRGGVPGCLFARTFSRNSGPDTDMKRSSRQGLISERRTIIIMEAVGGPSCGYTLFQGALWRRFWRSSGTASEKTGNPREAMTQPPHNGSRLNYLKIA